MNTLPRTILQLEACGMKIGDRAAKRWGVDVGDRVAVETMLSCRHCGPCVSGSYHLNDTRRSMP